MRKFKMDWTLIGSLACLVGGFIFDEIARAQDNAETKKEMKDYIDKKLAGINPDAEEDKD